MTVTTTTPDVCQCGQPKAASVDQCVDCLDGVRAVLCTGIVVDLAEPLDVAARVRA